MGKQCGKGYALYGSISYRIRYDVKGKKCEGNENLPFIFGLIIMDGRV